MNVHKIRANRLEASSIVILENLKDLDVNDLIFELYLPVKNDETKKLIYYFEQELILAKTKPNLFKHRDKRYKRLKELIKWIKENNKYRLFTDFSMYIFRNIEKKRAEVLNSYQTLMMDTWANLAPYGYYWYGLNENDEPLFMPEVYDAYDIEGYELAEKIKKKQISKREGYMKMLDIEARNNAKANDERNITNVIYAMIGLIDEENQDFIFPFQEWFNHYEVIMNTPRKYKENDFYLDMLDKRSYLLNSDGVIVKCYNAGLFKEIRFKEEFLDDGLIVLFRVTNPENGHTMGFIDLRNKFLYNSWKHSSNNDFSNDFMNFILEIYCELTCDFEKKTKRLVALKRIDSPYDVVGSSPEQPLIYCETNNTESSGTSGSKNITKKAFHKVKPFIRKGNASEIAKANARKYGMILPQGYTFVREHTRGKLKEMSK